MMAHPSHGDRSPSRGRRNGPGAELWVFVGILDCEGTESACSTVVASTALATPDAHDQSRLDRLLDWAYVGAAPEDGKDQASIPENLARRMAASCW